MMAGWLLILTILIWLGLCIALMVFGVNYLINRLEKKSLERLERKEASSE
jgi:hypothetical protein